jgi:hypothetical protein
VLRTAAQAKLPSPQNNPHLAPFLCVTNSRPAAWYAQGLPFMNKTSWAKLYSTSQPKINKSPSSSNRFSNNTPTPRPTVRATSYASTGRPAPTDASSARIRTPLEPVWAATPLPHPRATQVSLLPLKHGVRKKRQISRT